MRYPQYILFKLMFRIYDSWQQHCKKLKKTKIASSLMIRLKGYLCESDMAPPLYIMGHELRLFKYCQYNSLFFIIKENCICLQVLETFLKRWNSFKTSRTPGLVKSGFPTFYLISHQANLTVLYLYLTIGHC